MTIHYYLSLIPESLIASMVGPEEFGSYYSVGANHHTRGQAIFFEVDPVLAAHAIEENSVRQRCVKHADGNPRMSSYLRIYRALESVPVRALTTLYLTTEDGRVLPLKPAPFEVEKDRALHLYQELAPVTPRVVSKLNPIDFCSILTDPKEPVSLPKLVFAELKLEQLLGNPSSGDINNLPYPNLEHLRDCIQELTQATAKPSKIVARQMRQDFLYRTIRGGFFVGDQNEFTYFPMPSVDDLETKHYAWWRSALSSFGC